ncbi:MAG TPA: site-specific integrase [Solirubrobacteraceae bacterium]|nr:site-specific integrase [Solirubrobacteraceae bacterium]
MNRTPEPRQLPAISVVVEPPKTVGGLPFWVAYWREAGRQTKKRVGAAWLAPSGSVDARPGGKTYGRNAQWTQRRGRPPADTFDETAARAAATAFVGARLAMGEEERRKAAQAAASFRTLAREWQAHMVRTGGHKPSTQRDVESTLAEPGIPFARGTGITHGRVMRVIGDLPADRVRPADIEKIFDLYDEAGASARSVNKCCEVLRAVFNYGCDPRRGWGLHSNPAALTDRRRQHTVAGIRHFEVVQVEAIARAAEAGEWREESKLEWRRNPEVQVAEQAENVMLGELIRVAAYTGLRQGEIVALKWQDVDFETRVLQVARAVSAGVELSPKSGKVRVVPLAEPAFEALRRVAARYDFKAPDDYVFAGPDGNRQDTSALRRRYDRARDAAGAPPLPFHALRHTAASLLIRKLNPANVQAIMGHASVKTTERYMHAQMAADLVDQATAAFATKPVSSKATS